MKFLKLWIRDRLKKRNSSLNANGLKSSALESLVADCIFQRQQHQSLFCLLLSNWNLLIRYQGLGMIFPPFLTWVGPAIALTNRTWQKYAVSVLGLVLSRSSNFHFMPFRTLALGEASYMKNHKWCLKYLLLVRSQAMSLCFTNSLKTLLQPPCLRLAIEATKLQGTISWFFMPISTWN